MPDEALPILDQLAPPPEPRGQILVSESFFSIQGEGMLTGVPSYFIRYSGCNLRCTWCDTPYASWKPEGTLITVDNLLAEAARCGARHAVLTGGEPMLFSSLCELSTRLSRAGLHITIETAGTVLPTHPSYPLTCDLMSISPKLASSTPSGDPRDPTGIVASRHEARRLNLPVLQHLLDSYPAPRRQLKFVIAAEHDLIEIEQLLARLRGVSPADILLMPEGTSQPTPAAKHFVTQACLSKGYRYCTRLHIDLFGNRRGT